MAHVEKWPPLARDPRQRTRWRARWGPDGKTQSKVFAKKVDAEQPLTSVTHSTRSGAYVDPTAGRVSVTEYAAEWRERGSAWPRRSGFRPFGSTSMHARSALANSS